MAQRSAEWMTSLFPWYLILIQAVLHILEALVSAKDILKASKPTKRMAASHVGNTTCFCGANPSVALQNEGELTSLEEIFLNSLAGTFGIVSITEPPGTDEATSQGSIQQTSTYCFQEVCWQSDYVFQKKGFQMIANAFFLPSLSLSLALKTYAICSCVMINEVLLSVSPTWTSAGKEKTSPYWGQFDWQKSRGWKGFDA